MRNKLLLIALLVMSGGLAHAGEQVRVYSTATGGYFVTEKILKSAAAWRASLSEEQFRVLREQGTEPPYTGRYHETHEPGVYRCAGCALELFSAQAKYDSGTGWPSFFAPIAPENVVLRQDHKLWTVRNEVICARCEGHLGHVFDDGPPPTGLRYCINSASLEFLPAQARAEK